MAASASLTAVSPRFLSLLFHLDSIDTTRSVVIIRFLWFAMPVSLLCFLLFCGPRRTGEWLHRYRWAIGAALIAVAVLLNVSGSSLGMWDDWLGHDMSQGVVWGTPRSIRSDEYIVGTPLAFSQAYNDYGYFNALFGNKSADMFIIKDAPVITWAEIFRPFHWGYLVFGSARGLAFYWSARLVVLFLTAYEFFLCIVNERVDGVRSEQVKHKGVACLGASLITFAPLTQWWFAVNSLPEMLIAVFTAIVCFDRYLLDPRSSRRAAYLAVICGCAGMYVLSLYPAWQITLGYVLVMLIAFTIVRRWSHIRICAVDIVVIMGELLLFAGIMATVVVLSFDTIQSTMSTVYPGSRKSVGGGYQWPQLLSSTATLMLPFKEFVVKKGVALNTVEISLFVDLFPIGIVLSVINMVRVRKADVLSILLIVVVTILAVFMCVGFPLWLSSALMLTAVPSGRAMVAFGVANIILLVRAVAQRQWHLPAVWIILIGIAYTAADIWGAHRVYSVYMDLPACLVCLALCVMLAMSVLPHQVAVRSVAMIASVAVLFVSGMSVNPVQHGTAPLTGQPMVAQVRSVQQNDPGMWVTDGTDSAILANLLVANGIRTLNALEVTPDMGTWRKLDPDGAQEKIYNRYAYISVNLEQDAQQTFQLISPDMYLLRVSPAQLKSLGVSYILTDKDLTAQRFDGYAFEQVGQTIDGRTPYRIVKR
ncbi:hypothetical protein KIH76_10695 [Bifidobacterium sp. 81T8]|nr:hypothetical protein [Bifidobacterium simiiventris]